MIWFQDAGIGYYPVKPSSVYDAEYFERYQRQAETPIGRRLMEIRVAQVNAVTTGEVVDVGIGCGAFIQARNERAKASGQFRNTFGFDVNPAGKRWLEEAGAFVDPYATCVDSISLWDVLEHITDFAPLLRQVRKFVFVSLPIFRNADHARKSKHFRPDEHCWFFTELGLICVMSALGFRCIESHTKETDAGREDIGSYTFMRR